MRNPKIKFSLKLKDGAEARGMDELRENFDLEKVIGYFHDGKLVRWLEDRFYVDEAEEIKQLSENDLDFGKKLCDILGADYTEVEDVETIKWRKARMERLLQYTADEKILEQIDWVAFDQEDLESIVDDKDMPSTVYLCQNTYVFPSGIYRKKNMHWVGIGKSVKVIIRNRKPVDFEADGVYFENIDVEKEYIPIPPQQVNPIIEDETHSCTNSQYLSRNRETIMNIEKVLLKSKEICVVHGVMKESIAIGNCVELENGEIVSIVDIECFGRKKRIAMKADRVSITLNGVISSVRPGQSLYNI